MSPSQANAPLSAEEAVLRIVEGTSAATGPEFFRSLVRHLAETFRFRYAMVGELIGVKPEVIRTRAVWNGTEFARDFEYELYGSPCENVVGKRFCEHLSETSKQFPRDELLARMRIEAYLGVPLFGAGGVPLGVLAVMHDEPAERLEYAGSILKLFATRAASELERERKDEALRQSERRYQALADTAAVGIFRVNLRGHCLYVNQRASEIMGLTAQQACGRGWAWHFREGQLEDTLVQWQKAADSKQTWATEYEYQRPDGTSIWVLCHVNAERGEAGEVTGFICALTEITARKRDEKLLSENEARLSLIVNQMPAVLWTTDLDLIITSGSGAALLAIEQRRNEFVGVYHPSLFNHDETAPGVMAHRQAVRGESSSFEQEWKGRIFQCHVEPLRGPGGDVTGVIGVALDITERKQAEQALRDARDLLESRVKARTAELSAAVEALRESEQRYDSILNSTRTLVSRVDTDGLVTYCNEAHVRTFGPMIGEHFLARVHPDDVARTVEAMETVKRPPHTCMLEHRMMARGEWHMFLWEGGVVRDREGNLREIQGVGFDITERRLAQEALRQSEQRWREAADRANEVAESNRRLVLEVDHRVRNNLAGLLSLVSAMKHKITDVQAFAGAIEGRLLAMTHVHQVLADTGWRRVDLRTLASSLLSAVERLGCHDIPVIVQGPAVTVPPRHALPLSMILLEWFTNSCKYGAYSVPTGTVQLTWELLSPPTQVRLRWREQGGPPVTPPRSASLGTELVRSFATLELRGGCELRYPPEGADHLLTFPVEDPSRSAPSGPTLALA